MTRFSSLISALLMLFVVCGVARLQDSNLLAQRTVREATIQFHALCEGLAALELRATFPPEDAARIWRDALTALIAGFAITPPRQRPARTTTPRRPTKQGPS